MTPLPARPVLDFLVVGAQRSSTTHLSACLRDHPELYMCRDEVPYFESPFFTASASAELAAAVAGARTDQRRGIQRPDYLARPECPGNIRSVVPDARILAILRDPVARAISAYHWYMQFGLLPLRPLDEGMQRLLDDRLDSSYPRSAEVLELGFYGRHVGRYLDAFGPDQVLVLLDEDLRDPTTLPAVYRFLGVSPDHRSGIAARRTNAGTYDLRRLRLLRARHRFAWSWDDVGVYSYRRRRLRRPLSTLVSAAVVGVDRAVLARVLTERSPTLAPDLHERLCDLYAADVAALESLIGRDLSTWCSAVKKKGQPCPSTS